MEYRTCVCALFIFLFAVSSLEIVCTQNVSCFEDERRALIQFKESLVDQSNRLSSWIGDNCCKWKGVSCNVVTGHVVNLDLSNKFPNAEDLATVMSRESWKKWEKFKGTVLGEWLIMSDANISDMIPAWFRNITLSLGTIDLSNNKLAGGLEAFCDAQRLSTIDLHNNLLSGSIPSCFGNLQRLIGLTLSDNNLEGHIPSSLGALGIQLSYLHLQNNRLSGKLPPTLQNLTNLRSLHLGENNFKDTIPAWLGRRVNFLQILRLNSNEFFGDIPLQLCQIRFLCVLNLGGNNLDGSIPHCFRNFTCMKINSRFDTSFGFSYNERLDHIMKGRSLEYSDSQISLLKFMDLSENNFVGGIPEELTELKGLQSLNLSSNNLNGSIPKMIGNMEQLQALDLSLNKFSGPVPQGLASLNFLSYLNLSFNKLSGPIPTGNQLQSLDDKSIYAGNNGLCGWPLLKSCHDKRSTSQPNLDQDDKGDDAESNHLWFYTGIGPGFCVGFVGVLTILHFKNSWRVIYFQFLEDVYNKLYLVFF